MTDAEKLVILKTLLNDGGTLPSDDTLSTYLSVSEQEILNWIYAQVGGVPSEVTSVPVRYEMTQIYAVVAGYSHAGAEGESQHNENGIGRTFIYSDMLDYIHKNVYALTLVM